ncbi:MAG: hypothetical protein WD673_14860 [Alphaproteobacteria bacterium]
MAIHLEDDQLVFDFTAYHPEARFSFEFQRTLRIPDNGEDHWLPPGLGRFPMRHVEEYEERLPASWVNRGGVLFPMYQAEAMWLSFHAGDYPFAVKVASGKINVVTGESWSVGLNRDPRDYLVVPGQPWLDGYCVEKGVIRQFVAMPLGQGYTAEEQLTGEATWGGLQVVVYPLKKELFRPKPTFHTSYSAGIACMDKRSGMGLAPGGRMRQEVYEDDRALSDWDQRKGERCFIAILNSEDWLAVTDEPLPTRPVSAKDYAKAGLPWFDYYADRPAVSGAPTLRSLKSLAAMSDEKGDAIPELKDSVPITRVLKLGNGRRGAVRVGDF